MAGRVVHFEVPYDDGERAQQFYRTAFGWQTMSPPGMDYVLASSGPSGEQGPTEPGYINGGMMQRDDTFTGPNLVIDVESVDAAIEAVTAAGGSVVRGREPVADMGFTGYVRDTEGNLLGLWESA